MSSIDKSEPTQTTIPPLDGCQSANTCARIKPINPRVPMKPLLWSRIQMPVKPMAIIPATSPDEVDSNDSSESSEASAQNRYKCLWDNIGDKSLVNELIDEEFVANFRIEDIQKKIHELSDRDQCTVYENKFSEQLSTIDNRLNHFKMLCQSLTTTNAIRDIFEIILTCCNYMNGGDRGQAYCSCFRLEILPKLRDVKANNSISLLEYVVRKYIQKFYPDVISSNELPFVLPEPSDLEKASALVFKELESDIISLENELINIQTIINKVLVNTQNEQHLYPFQERMKWFTDKALDQIEEQKDNVKECKVKFRQTMQFFSHKPKSGKESDWPKEFFANWIPFCYDFKNIFKREIQRTINQNAEKTKKLKELTKTRKKE